MQPSKNLAPGPLADKLRELATGGKEPVTITGTEALICARAIDAALSFAAFREKLLADLTVDGTGGLVQIINNHATGKFCYSPGDGFRTRRGPSFISAPTLTELFRKVANGGR